MDAIVETREYSNIILSEEKDSVMNKIDALKIGDMYEKKNLKIEKKISYEC